VGGFVRVGACPCHAIPVALAVRPGAPVTPPSARVAYAEAPPTGWVCGGGWRVEWGGVPGGVVGALPPPSVFGAGAGDTAQHGDGSAVEVVVPIEAEVDGFCWG